MMVEERKKSRFIGDYESVIDGKARVGLGRFSQCFGEGAVALRMGDHLVLLTPEQFDTISDKFFDMDLQPFQRHFYSNAFEVSIDASGRFTIPAKLYEKLQLTSNVTWVGCGDRLELWNREQYNKDAIIWEHEGGPARVASLLNAPKQPVPTPASGPADGSVRDRE
jgi:MraZ protein